MKEDVIKPGANPTILSYNASAVKIYSATSNTVRFEKQKILCTLKKLTM
jgi:hypothetical protein